MIVLAGTLALFAFGAIVVRPQFAAYVWLLANPFIVGFTRGGIVPGLRPNELLFVLILAALAVRAVLVMLGRQPYRPQFDRLDLALILLALTSSALPMAFRYGRGLPVSTDDLLYAVVLWKYYLLYRVFRGCITTVQQVSLCLWISMAAAAVVALVGMLQVGNLLGVPEFLHAYYDQPFEGHLDIVTDRATSTIGSSFGFADMMIMNFVIAAALLHGRFGRKALLALATALFLFGCIAAGAFSGVIGLAVAALVFGLVSGHLVRLLIIGVPAAMIGSVVFWPVIANRLAGFENSSGLPQSWTGRWENLERFFLPELFSGFNWLIGVRPAPRLPAPETWRDFVFIESGYVWLLWIGGIPLAAAFAFFIVASAQSLRKIVQERTDAVAVTALASLSYLFVILTLMLFDPHLTVRGSADLFFPLLALSLVRARNTELALPKRARSDAARSGRLERPAYGSHVAFDSGRISGRLTGSKHWPKSRSLARSSPLADGPFS